MKARWLAGATLCALLLPPVLALAYSLYGEHGMFFWDGRTIPCGLQSFNATGNPNAYLRDSAYPGPCAGYGYEYMLPPAVTAALAALLRGVGPDAFNVAYVLLYGGALAVLLRGAARFAGGWTAPLALAGLIACGVFVFEAGGGNITVPLLALLFLLCTQADRHPQRFAWTIPLCAVAAAFKPFYALYLLLPWFAQPALRLRVLAACSIVSGGYALDAWLQPAAFARWLNLIVPVVYAEPHFGIMRLMQALGLGAGDWWLQAGGYALWCALVLALLWRCRPHLATPAARALAALLAVTLLQPRLKEYDAVVIIPLAFWLLAQLPAARRQRLRLSLLLACGIVPALWWWLRKLGLFIAIEAPTATQIADPRWLIETQGFFLAGAVLILFGFLVWPPARADTASAAP